MFVFVPFLISTLSVFWVVVEASFLPHNQVNKDNSLLSKRINSFSGYGDPTFEPPTENKNDAALGKSIEDASKKVSTEATEAVSIRNYWLDQSPAPKWAIPGPENPKGNPYYPNINYPQPPEGKDHRDCERQCLGWLEINWKRLPWIYDPDLVPRDQIRRGYCYKRCSKLHPVHRNTKFIPGVEQPTRDPPIGRSLTHCKVLCRDWYANPLYVSPKGRDPLVEERCNQHCSAIHSPKGPPKERQTSTKQKGAAPPKGRAPKKKKGLDNNPQNWFSEETRGKFGDAFRNVFQRISDTLQPALLKKPSSGFGGGLPSRYHHGPPPVPGLVIP